MGLATLYSYKEIEEMYGISYERARKIVYHLQLSRTFRGGKPYFTLGKVKKIAEYQRKEGRVKNNHHRRKISIIEEYMRQPSAKKTASVLRVQKELVNKTVKEWEENDHYIIVESALNHRDVFGIKNVYRRGSKWLYSWSNKGVRHIKSGFETEDEAFEALQKLKLSLKG